MSASHQNRFQCETSPVANKENCIIGDKYRITVLLPQLLRVEYSEDGIFEDRASQSVFFREFPNCDFKKETANGILTVETTDLVLTYKENAEFNSNTLKIKLKNEPSSTWNFGEEFETLDGTVRTLDQVNGEIPLGKSVCSQYGFSVIDDSNTLLLGEDGWLEERNPDTLDFYFFGFGYAYLDAVKALYLLTGAPPLLPSYALGNWWSKCRNYSQEEYEELVNDFEKEGVPLSVAVVDFDWHIREVPKEVIPEGDEPRFYNGWTGYSWNKDLFPDYKAFLAFLHDKGLKTSLNLHPANGICCFEDMYEEMAKASGIDPESKERVPFDILSKKFVENYFDIVHRPYEKDGVDLWWIDWQQGVSCKRYLPKGYNADSSLYDKVDPLWMLNHLHSLDIKSETNRHLILSRYSGIGSHRYPIGFSGDTYITWKNLDFQPYFTASSSNIGYSWWSHDIGGFMRGYFGSELFLRWVQFGVFSPIFRLHSSAIGGEFIHKQPWTHKEPYKSILKQCMRLRHELFPYIYAMNYRNHAKLEPMIQPMYYNYPKKRKAYDYKNQYMFGSELMVCPITEPACSLDKMAKVDSWLPKGDWFDFFNGLHYHCDQDKAITFSRSIYEYPVFAKSGAIVPMFNNADKKNKIDLCDSVTVVVFPGSSNKFEMYEDSGDGYEYKTGKFATTELSLNWGKTPVFEINKPNGDSSLLPQKRNWNILFRGFNKNVIVKVFVDNKQVKVNQQYDFDTQTVSIEVLANINQSIRVEIEGNNLMTNNSLAEKRFFEILDQSEASVYRKIEYRDVLLRSEDTFKNKLLKLGGASSIEDQHLFDALCEMIVLKNVEETSTELSTVN